MCSVRLCLAEASPARPATALRAWGATTEEAARERAISMIRAVEVRREVAGVEGSRSAFCGGAMMSLFAT